MANTDSRYRAYGQFKRVQREHVFKEEKWDSEGIPSKIRGRQNRAKSSL